MGGGDVVVVAKGDILMRPVSPLPGWRTVLLPIGLMLSPRKDLAATMTPVDVTTGKFPTEPPPPPPNDDDGRRRRRQRPIRAVVLEVQQAKALVNPTNDTEDGGGRRMAIISIASERARARDRGEANDIIAPKKMLRCMFFSFSINK
jgi:hypothetical protein